MVVDVATAVRRDAARGTIFLSACALRHKRDRLSAVIDPLILQLPALVHAATAWPVPAGAALRHPSWQKAAKHCWVFTDGCCSIAGSQSFLSCMHVLRALH